MIIDFPDYAVINDVQLTHFQPTYSNMSLSYQQNSISRNIHQYQGSINVTVWGEENLIKWNAFTQRIQGKLNPVRFYLDNPIFNRSVQTNAITTSAVQAGRTQIPITGFNGQIISGQSFTIPNDTKVYTVLNTISSNQTADINPPLRKNLANGAILQFNRVPIVAYLNEDSITNTFIESGLIIQTTFSFKEVL